MIVDGFLKVNNGELSARQWEKLEKQLTFVNGEQEVIQAFRRIRSLSDPNGGYVKIPRGAWDTAPLDDLPYQDNRVKPKAPRLEFQVKLDNTSQDARFAGQSAAVKSMFQEEQGLIIRPPGTGKTQIALAFLAACETTGLVLVHTEDILQQWLEYARSAIPGVDLGVVRGGEYEIGQITIATVQTARKYLRDQWFWAQFGCVILDEAHHAAASSFEAVLNSCPAYYRFGFTASATRADGMHPLMQYTIGPVIHKQKFSSPVEVRVVPTKTNFKFLYRGRSDWHRLLDALVTDEERNKMIAEVVDREIREGNSVLVLSRRIEHLERIAALCGEHCEILTGSRKRKDRANLIADFRSGDVRAVLATQLADEALDVQRLNRVVLVHPGKHEGRIIQQIGRALRTHPTKQDALIYDFIDGKVGVLRHQWSQRRRTYRQNKISIKSNGRLSWR